jgi:acylphosphatase
VQQAALHAVVHGLVQGVNFRYFVLRRAEEMRLTGYVRNLRDGSVEVVAEGDQEKLQALLEQLGVGPRSAHVKQVKVEWTEYSGSYTGFGIRF